MKKKICVSICSDLAYNLSPLVSKLLESDVDEVLVVGTKGNFFIFDPVINDPRLKRVYEEKSLSKKRNRTLAETKCDIVAFVDDDAMICDGWVEKVLEVFERYPDLSCLTGPSIGHNLGVLGRAIQLAMGFSPKSNKRYSRCTEGLCNWHDIIGANMAFRRLDLTDVGGWDDSLSCYGEEMAVAGKLFLAGKKFYYSPDFFVWHNPKPFISQMKAIFKCGMVSPKINQAPKTSSQFEYVLFVPVYISFCLSYLSGKLFGLLGGSRFTGALEDVNAWAKRKFVEVIR